METIEAEATDAAGAYRRAVISAFRERSVRSVVLIDDQFATYDELNEGIHRGQDYIGAALHRAFRLQGLPCDIENDPNLMEGPMKERLRNSDLIIIDYNLDGDADPRSSVRLLRDLAASSYFNLAVVYTSEHDLNIVWRNVALKLRGGWQPASEILTDETLDVFLSQNTAGIISDFDELFWVSWLNNDSSGYGPYKGSFVKQISEPRLKRDIHRVFISAVGETSIQILNDAYSDAGHNMDALLDVRVGCNGETRWVLAGSLFVTFVRKETADHVADHEFGIRPESIVEKLDEALVSWGPNPLQIVLMEALNDLKKEPLISKRLRFRDGERDAAFAYGFLYEAEIESGGGQEGYEAALRALTRHVFDEMKDPLLDKVNARLKADRDLRTLFLGAVQLVPVGSYHERMARAYQLSKQPAGTEEGARKTVALLNVLVATREGPGRFVTNGSIFMSGAGESFWLVTTPACDLVPRRSTKSTPFWPQSLEPFRRVTAIRLERVGLPEALPGATDGHFVFVLENGEPIALRAFNQLTRQPQVEDWYVPEFGRLGAESVFQGLRVSSEIRDETSQLGLAETSCRVLARLRAPFAERFLHHAGFHLSRVGVDFVAFGDRAASEENDPVPQPALQPKM